MKLELFSTIDLYSHVKAAQRQNVIGTLQTFNQIAKCDDDVVKRSSVQKVDSRIIKSYLRSSETEQEETQKSIIERDV